MFHGKAAPKLVLLPLVSLTQSDQRKEWFELCIEEHESEHTYESPATEREKKKRTT
jgi:hypothetical protein